LQNRIVQTESTVFMKTPSRVRVYLQVLFLCIPVFLNAQPLLRIPVLTGTFVTTERPEDYPALLQWRMSPVKVSGSTAEAVFHERTMLRAGAKPYNQQVWLITKSSSGTMIAHYTFREAPASNPSAVSLDALEHHPELDLPLELKNGGWEGTIAFTAPEYLKQFVEKGHSAKVSARFDSISVYYHLQIFDAGGQQVYGPKKKGYLLKRKQAP
jgi:hypothetical protein